MSDFVIEAEVRTVTGKKVKQLRVGGLVPGVIYGPKFNTVTIQMAHRALEITLRHAGGTNLIDINTDGEKYMVLARDVQRDVLKGNILHVDFLAVDETTIIQAAIPVHIVGHSPVVEGRLGILVTGPNSIRVEALAGKLMNSIEIDISVLVELGDQITVSDLDLGEGVRIIDDPDEMIARVVQTSAARAEEDLVEGEEAVLETGAEPEVISRGKDEEEDED